MSSRRQVLEATLALLRTVPHGAYSGRDVAERRPRWECLDALDWHAFVAFASAHFVLPALAGPLTRAAAAGGAVPADLLEFVLDIQSANASRNTALKTALLEIAGRLNDEGIEPIALKGAAFLLDDSARPPGWRFMGDIDLLVPEQALSQCVRILGSIGHRAARNGYDPEHEAHYPPLVSPCGAFSIELHTRLFALSDFGIPPACAARRALSSGQGGSARVRVLDPADRIAHLVGHAQLHNRNFAARRLVLKDLLDLSMLPRSAIEEFERAGLETTFAEPRQRAASQGLIAAWHEALEPETARPLPPGATRWATAALRRLTWPRWRSLATAPADVLELELHRLLSERGHLARRARQLLSPELLRESWRAWSFKQRQRLWS